MLRRRGDRNPILPAGRSAAASTVRSIWHEFGYAKLLGDPKMAAQVLLRTFFLSGSLDGGDMHGVLLHVIVLAVFVYFYHGEFGSSNGSANGSSLPLLFEPNGSPEPSSPSEVSPKDSVSLISTACCELCAPPNGCG